MKLTVSESDIGKRIDVFVAEAGNVTRSATQKLIDEQNVLVNGHKTAKNYRLRAGDTVELSLPEPVADKAEPENIPIEIVYEDSDLAIVNKPKGMVVHPAAGNRNGTMVNALLFRLGDSLSGINGVIRPGIVHRIDKDTSGLLIVAKNNEAHLKLAEQIKEHFFTRRYHAIVVGNLKEDSGTVNAPVGRHPIHRKKMAIVSDGRPAITHWRVLERFQGFTYVELTLETGRTHQIRVHMSSLGHPVIGDELYGAGHSKFELQNNSLLSGQCLHAKYIAFTHPSTGLWMEFDSRLPEYFVKILEKLRKQGDGETAAF